MNSDDFPPTSFDTVFKAAGLDTLSYAPTASAIPATGWPTLGSMIDSGKRLVTFLDASADFTSIPYLIDGKLYLRSKCIYYLTFLSSEFTNIWETAFDVTDPAFDCNVNRSKGDTSTEMYLINHYLDTLTLGQPTPDRDQANVTNGVSGPGSLGEQVQTCAAEYGRNPNFLLVDVSIL